MSDISFINIGVTYNTNAWHVTTNPYGLGGEGVIPEKGNNLANLHVSANAEFNAMLINNSSGYLGTSSSSVTIAIALLTFTLDQAPNYLPNMDLLGWSISNPNQKIYTTIDSWNPTTKELILNVYNAKGDGTIASDWAFMPGSLGPTGATGGGGTMNALADDISPLLNADLDANDQDITSVRDISVASLIAGGSIGASSLEILGGINGKVLSIDVSTSTNFVDAEINKRVRFTNPLAITKTLGLDSTFTNAPVKDERIEIAVKGDGDVTFTAAAGVTVNGVTAGSITLKKGQAGAFFKTGTANTWDYEGIFADKWA